MTGSALEAISSIDPSHNMVRACGMHTVPSSSYLLDKDPRIEAECGHREPRFQDRLAPFRCAAQSAQYLDKVGQIRWPWGFESHLLLPGRVEEPEHPSMQRLARKAGCGFERGFFFFRTRPRRLAAAAIGRIADQRVADMGKVHADLMRAPGFQPAFEKRRDRFLIGAITFQHSVIRLRRLAP